MAIVDTSGFAHIRLTVTDIARSKAFYDQVFGFEVFVDNSDRVEQLRDSQADFYGGTIYRTPSGALLGLRPVAPDDQRFDADRTGLDHLSFTVGSRRDLETAHDAFHAAGIVHGQITDLTDAGIAILSFSDPDGVHLELTAPLS